MTLLSSLKVSIIVIDRKFIFDKYTESCFFRFQRDDSIVCVMHLQYQIRSFASTINSGVVSVGKMAKPIKCFAPIFNSYLVLMFISA